MSARFAHVQGDPIMDTIREAIEQAIIAESTEQPEDETAEQDETDRAEGEPGE
jgi:DNA-binding cell septation regulator SpoVG